MRLRVTENALKHSVAGLKGWDASKRALRNPKNFPISASSLQVEKQLRTADDGFESQQSKFSESAKICHLDLANHSTPCRRGADDYKRCENCASEFAKLPCR